MCGFKKVSNVIYLSGKFYPNIFILVMFGLVLTFFVLGFVSFYSFFTFPKTEGKIPLNKTKALAISVTSDLLEEVVLLGCAVDLASKQVFL